MIGRRLIGSAFINANWLLLEKVSRLLYGVFIMAYLARYLNPNDFGLYNYIIASVSLLSPIATLGVDQVITRDLIKDPNKANSILGSSILMKLIGSMILVVIILLCLKLGIYDIEGAGNYYFVIVAIGFGINSVSVFEAWFGHNLTSKYVAISKIGATFCVSICTIYFIKFNYPLVYFFYLYALERFIWAIGYFYYYPRISQRSLFKLNVNIETIKKLWSDSWPLFLAGFAHTVHLDIDRIMLGQMIGDTAVGVYSAGTRLVYVWGFIAVVISNSLFPHFVKISTSEDLFLRQLQKVSDVLVWASVFAALVVSLLSSFIIETLYGSEYNDAAPILAIAFFASVFTFYGQVTAKYVLIHNLKKVPLWRTSISACINVVLNFLLIPQYGVIGAAIATLVSTIFQAWISMALFRSTYVVFLMFIKSFNLFRVRQSFKEVFNAQD